MAKKISRRTAYLYECADCYERFIGYGDDDPRFQAWRDAHRKWHTQGIQEAGRHTIMNPPPKQFGRPKADTTYFTEL